MRQLRYYLGKLISLLYLLLGCHPVYAILDCSSSDATFQVHFLNKGWRDYKLHSYKYPIDVLLSERNIDLKQDSMFCVTEADIELYNWPSQTIFFDKNFIHKLRKRKQEVEKMQQSGELDESKSGSDVFVLTFNGSRVYGGVVNESYAAGYNVPTLFFTHDSDGRIIVVIRPLKTFESTMTGYSALDDSLKKIVEKPEIEDFFLKLGKL